jgi:benzil reductase ((S)-benzoin forming)
MKLAIITGGSKGLGKALVEHYQADGWQVCELSRSGSGAHHVAVDLAQINAAMQAIAPKFTALAAQPWERVVMLNNAGAVTPIGPVGSLPDEDIQKNLNINFSAGVRVISAFVRSFNDCGGNKVVANVSSGAATKGYPGWALYCGAKAGMENFVRTLAAEQTGAANPMTCINFGPGVIDTDMQAQLRSCTAQQFADVERFKALKEAGQLRTPASVAATLKRLLDGELENGQRYSVEQFD